MIEVRNLNKYFNKNKNTEIHVINSTNLDFPKTGLVCLLGPSGSGKTTMLNVIGGLDAPDSGEIIFDNISIKKYNAKKWDMIRNHHFGYIFQNYVLLPELTVFQNLEFVLKMLNLSQEEINTRIDYALNAVGMLHYKKRKPSQLSGGQQQRVAIARALVKSPDVVIADEPTGNLDEKNTTQIMSIIKKISKECLVILVTHERRLAEFYGDYIIEILDGKIVRKFKTDSDKLHYEINDNNIYLQELDKNNIDNEDVNIQYFYSEEKKKLDLMVIFKNNTFYIKSNQDNVNIKYIEKDNEIKIIDSKKPIINQESIDSFDYHLPKIQKKDSYKSVLSFKETFRMALSHLKGLRRKQKLMFIVFVLSSIMVLIGFINLASNYYVDDKEFLSDNRNLVVVEGTDNFKYNDFIKLEKDLGKEMLWTANSVSYTSLSIKNLFTQTKSRFTFPANSVIPIETVQNPKLLYGALPTKIGEACLDMWLVEKMLVDPEFRAWGIMYPEQFIGTSYYNNFISFDGEIVGIIDNNNPNIYANMLEYQVSAINTCTNRPNWFSNMFTVETFTEITEYKNFELQTVPYVGLEKNQVIVSDRFINFVPSSKKVKFGNGMDDTTFEVIGYFNSDDSKNHVILAEEDVKLLLLESLRLTSFNPQDPNAILYNDPCVYADDKEVMIAKIEKIGLSGIDLYREERQLAITTAFNDSIYSIALIILIASLILLYFIMRSSLISRVYEVGVYRALGVKKSNIYKLFLSEIFIITMITSLIGIGLVSWIIIILNNAFSMFYFPWYVIIGSLIFTLGCNIIVGLLPVFNLLKLTPSQILSKYDI